MRGLKQLTKAQAEYTSESHLLQMRGLKPIQAVARRTHLSRIFYRCVDWNHKAQKRILVHLVASFTDAWIETADNTEEYQPPFVASFTDAWIETVFVCHVWKRTDQVASFTDAWIETCNADTPTYIGFGRIFYRCVDWNFEVSALIFFVSVASFTDAWIETFQTERPDLTPKSHLLQMRGLKQTRTTSPALIFSRIFYRCVDWNRLMIS